MLNYFDIALEKVSDISEIKFLSEKNESLKKLIISSLLEGDDQETIKSKISVDYKKLIEEIQENSSIQIILKTKNNEAILELLNELISELKELNNLKKIESLEKKLINNLDENSYSELIKLKSQINRE
jgi:Mg/Co/Ni transporter MgtE